MGRSGRRLLSAGLALAAALVTAARPVIGQGATHFKGGQADVTTLSDSPAMRKAYHDYVAEQVSQQIR